MTEATHLHPETEYTVTRYECTKCGAEDSDTSPPERTPPHALSCHKCHAGQGLDFSKMYATRAGMFPVIEEAKDGQ